MPQHVYGYTRVSTAKQGEGVSLVEQRDAIERYAIRNALSVTAWFEERETAAKQGRPVFTAMLKLLQAGKAAGVVMHKIDRSARNLRDWVDINELIDHGISIHFAHESIDLRSRGGRLSADIQAVIAADFIRNLREETRKGFYGRLKQGLYPLPAPVGYVDRGRGKVKEIDPVSGPLVRAAFELYGTGEYGIVALAEELYRRGLRSRRNGRLSKNGISVLLNNPFYVGRIRLKSTGETFSGSHEPLISISLFERTQRVLAGKTVKGIGKHGYLYRRLFRCAECNYSLIGETQKGHIYYRCHTVGCKTTTVRETAIEEMLHERFARAELSDQEVDDVLSIFPEICDRWEAERVQRTTSVELQLARARERSQRVTDAYLDGVLPRDEHDQRKQAFETETERLTEQLSNSVGTTETIAERVREFLELARSLRLSYSEASPEEKRRLLDIVTSNRLVAGRQPAIELRSPFLELAERPSVLKCDPHRDRDRTLTKKLALFIQEHMSDPLVTKLAEERMARQKEEKRERQYKQMLKNFREGSAWC